MMNRRAIAISLALHVALLAAALSRPAPLRDPSPPPPQQRVELRIVTPSPASEVAPAPARPAVPPPPPARELPSAAVALAAPPPTRADADRAAERPAPERRPATPADDADHAANQDAAERSGREGPPVADAGDAARAEPPSASSARDPGDARPDKGDPRRARDLDLALRAAPPTAPRPPIDPPAPAAPAEGTGTLPPGLEPTAGGTWRYADGGFTAHIARDGTVHFEDHLPVGLDAPVTEHSSGFAFRLDLTEAAMRAVGDDPYRHEKAKFLAQTEAFRAELCGRDRTERMRASILRLPGELDRIWRAGGKSATERRLRLFELWDGCAESSGGDPELARIGAMARATVIGFIQRRLPAGSPDAYRADELALLNRRRASRATFDPYAPITTGPGSER